MQIYADNLCYFNGTIMLLHTAEMNKKWFFLYLKCPLNNVCQTVSNMKNNLFLFLYVCFTGKTFGLGFQICLSVHNIFLTSNKLNQKETKMFILYAVLDHIITTIFSFMWAFYVHKCIQEHCQLTKWHKIWLRQVELCH
jgi:hypothetical protein